MWPSARTILLLVASNLFMTAAWYGHRRCLQVPANRWGSARCRANEAVAFVLILAVVVVANLPRG